MHAQIVSAAALCLLFPLVAAAAERRGKWGELPSHVPEFAPTQERRAPKLPANNKLWAEVAGGTVERLDGALLICYAEITPKHGQKGAPHAASYVPAGADWDTFNGPDTLFRWQIGKQQVAQWGPEDHWKMYISIPAVTLGRGE